MLLEVYIMMQILAFIIFFLGFFLQGRENSEILIGLGAVLFGILAIGSVAVQSLEPRYNATGNYYYIESYTHFDLTMIWVNVLFLSLSLVLFYIDIMEKYRPKNKIDGGMENG